MNDTINIAESSAATPTYTLADVQKRNKAYGVWVITHGLVYDVIKYFDDHPGDAAVLHEVAGIDATEAFKEVSHSIEANDELKMLYTGDLASEDRAASIKVF
ncbi:uncharacterized protein CTHT_0031620 [Thermochaetoides thermophila DSM 1495]|uniref:Cytochrome b5 heme-binding domain-containing protein n=1 Tax=Chaetomium thermophilum (strain DSM 1495 / CBS 144.50 / IMI 039719) TaxID=759272 RepID=G0S4N3_CHATD|nr:hypothetical protein CTHT_0031620 [Thermochaetoides thermophila DSM 1495]EGS21308.1 hypothetical protein CTHT_0031620 [Thermochaetoides thermophila DSM 1495]